MYLLTRFRTKHRYVYIYIYIYIFSQESFTADRFDDNALLKRATRCTAQEEANYTRKHFFVPFIGIKETSVNSHLCWHFTR